MEVTQQSVTAIGSLSNAPRYDDHSSGPPDAQSLTGSSSVFSSSSSEDESGDVFLRVPVNPHSNETQETRTYSDTARAFIEHLQNTDTEFPSEVDARRWEAISIEITFFAAGLIALLVFSAEDLGGGEELSHLKDMLPKVTTLCWGLGLLHFAINASQRISAR